MTDERPPDGPAPDDPNSASTRNLPPPAEPEAADRQRQPDAERQLGALAAIFNDSHGRIVAGERGLLPYAKTAGEALISAKALVKALHGHGKWLHWLKHNF